MKAEHRQLLLCLAIALLSRLLLLAQTPFEVDAVLLARGVLDFDPTAGRPHPPGYAGLIFLGKMMPFAPDLSLRVVCALAVVPLAGAAWALARRLGGDGMLAAALVAANPIAWQLGITENAYAVGAATAALTAAAALRHREAPSPANAALLGLAWGITGAVRPSEGVFLVAMALWAARGNLLSFAGAAALPTAAWLGGSAWASGGLREYLDSVWWQFTWIHEGQPDHWRLHQVHHLLVYLLVGLGGGLLLLPWARRVRHLDLLALWIGPALAFHLFVYVAKGGYVLSYVAAPAVILACGMAPRLARWAAPALSAALFLYAAPLDVERDPMPRRPFAEKTWAERVRSELSFFSSSSLERVRQQDRANLAYAALLGSRVDPGRSLAIWVDRWDAHTAEAMVPGLRVIQRSASSIDLPREGLRVFLLSWTPETGFAPLVGPEGYGAFEAELRWEDAPTEVAGIPVKRVD